MTERDLISELREEYKELMGKHRRLFDFMNSDKAIHLPERHIRLLNRQFDAMAVYLDTLEIRIDDLKKERMK